MDSALIEIVLPIAFKDVFDEVAPLFTIETGHKFNVALMLNPEVPDYVASGADWSVALSNPSYVQKIVDDGRCSVEGLQMLGHSPLCFAVRGHDDTAPSQSPHEIASFLGQAESIAITESGTSGAQFAKLAANLNIAQEVHAKLRLMPGGGPMAALKNGEVEVAALPLTNVAPVPGVLAKFICPPQMDVHIELALCLEAQANAATQQFATWLRQSDLENRLRELGLRDFNAAKCKILSGRCHGFGRWPTKIPSDGSI